MDKGMKIGTLIAMGLVVVVGIVFMLRLREPPDEPTSKTAPDKLKQTDLPAGLPTIWESEKPDLAAAGFYEKAIDYVVTNYPDAKKEPTDRVLREVSGLLIDGMQAGKVEKGLLDDLVPMKPQSKPPKVSAIPMVAVLGTKQAIKSADRGEHDRALKELLAVWAYGQRLVENSQRLDCRFYGLQSMQLALGELGHDEIMGKIPDGEAKLTAWHKAMGPVLAAWRSKIEMIWTVKPQAGDLINLARREEDPAIRIEAIRYLGVLKYLTKKKGNLQAIDDVLLAAKGDANPLFVQAAAGAESLTQQEFRKIR